ncbi:MAG TPA: adenosine kinase [Acidimicrobiia bacterium]|nr:adenosine kinase [Acidimicrobiia bacterium]
MTRFDLCAIGNALVDVLSQEPEEFVIRTGVQRGAMTMVDAARAEEIYSHMGPALERSGGSAANTAAGLTSLGGNAAYIGRVADDTFGKIFTHDLRNIGVQFDAPFSTGDEPTGRCLVIVTPDAQRTMCTHLGAASELDASLIDEQILRDTQVTYVEGYLWDQPAAKEAIRSAAAITHAYGQRFALTLSDPFCVERHRQEFLQLAEHHVDVLFANEHEITMLYETDTFDEALQHVRGHCEIAALTRGARGSVIVSGDELHVIDPVPTAVVDTTGAGDLFAAGFLYGLTHGHDLETCGRLGSLAASEIISHLGARPAVSLAGLARDLLG